METASLAPKGPQYRVVDGDPVQDRAAVLALWDGSLGQRERMREKYGWFYQGCPFGPPLLRFLQHVPTMTRVGTCSAGVRRMLWQGREIEAGLLADLAVLQEHRSLGPALILQQGMIESGRHRFDLLYGFPNAKAVPVFKRVGYSKLTDIRRHVRVIRHGDYLRRRVPAGFSHVLGFAIDSVLHIRDRMRSLAGARLKARWSQRADARFDALWQQSPHGDGLLAIRDREYAQWRFDEEPGGQTRYLLLGGNPGDQLQCWFATHAEDGILHVRDFWCADGIAGVAPCYIDALILAAHEAGYVAVSVETTCTPTRMRGWQSRGFKERSSRQVLGCWGERQVQVEAILDLHLTSADEDQ